MACYLEDETEFNKLYCMSLIHSNFSMKVLCLLNITFMYLYLLFICCLLSYIRHWVTDKVQFRTDLSSYASNKYLSNSHHTMTNNLQLKCIHLPRNRDTYVYICECML